MLACIIGMWNVTPRTARGSLNMAESFVAAHSVEGSVCSSP